MNDGLQYPNDIVRTYTIILDVMCRVEHGCPVLKLSIFWHRSAKNDTHVNEKAKDGSFEENLEWDDKARRKTQSASSLINGRISIVEVEVCLAPDYL